jgi:hypothetical protein
MLCGFICFNLVNAIFQNNILLKYLNLIKTFYNYKTEQFKKVIICIISKMILQNYKRKIFQSIYKKHKSLESIILFENSYKN